jgi:hypothetical protein
MRASFTLAQDEGTTNTGVKAWMAGTSPAMTNKWVNPDGNSF